MAGSPSAERRAQAGESRRGPRAAQDRPLHGPHGAAERGARRPAGGERVLEGREQRDRRGVFRHQPRGEPEIGAGRRLAERHTGRIVDRDGPAPELRRDPAGEGAVRRDQGGGAAGGLQRAPHDDGDDARLLLRARAVDAVDAARCRRVARRQRAPGGDGLGRPHGVGDQARADRCGTGARPVGARVGARVLVARPRQDVGARDADMVEQPLQRVLRVGGAERLPGLVIGVAVEAGEDDGALRQPRDGREQVACRGHAPGGAGGDHRMVRRLGLPALGEARQQRVAAGCGVHQAALRQNCGPGVGDEGEEAQHLLPMGRIVVGREGGELLRVEPGDLDLVEEGGERTREPRGLIHRAGAGQRRAAGRLAELEDQAREQQPALQRRDGTGQRLVGRVADALLVLVDIAEGLDAGQQQRLRRRRAQEGEAQRPAGAPRRQQDRETAERERVVALQRHDPAREEAGRQRIHERHGGWHRVEGGRAPPCAGAGRHPSSPRRPPRWLSACASPAGEPTWSTRPRCTSPNRRPARMASS